MSDLTDSLRSTAKHRAGILCAQTGAAKLYKADQMVEWEAADRILELEKCMETPRIEDLNRIEDLEDKLHECLCGDLENALGKVNHLEAALKRLGDEKMMVVAQRRLHNPSAIDYMNDRNARINYANEALNET